MKNEYEATQNYQPCVENVDSIYASPVKESSLIAQALRQLPREDTKTDWKEKSKENFL